MNRPAGSPLAIWRPRVIALIGIDGSGKTTSARVLAQWLTASGRPATYWQNAGGRRWFGRLARRLHRTDGAALLGEGPMLLIEAVLRWLAIARALLVSVLTGRVAVMDRYAYCQYASCRVRQNGERLARLAYRVFPRPEVTFLLAVAPEEAYRRITRRATDSERLDYLTAAAAAYAALPGAASFVRIDAGRPPDEVQRALRGALRQRRNDLPLPVVDLHAQPEILSGGAFLCACLSSGVLPF